MPRPAVPLVGRTAELAGLTAAVRAAEQGSAAALVVGGDAGVGKTRLLGELTSIAADAGFLVLVGHCIDLGDTPPPYLPLTEAFSRLAAERPELVDDVVTRFPALARLLSGRAAGAGGGPAGDDRVERGELFDSVRAALAHLAVAQPVALFVEDAHWADQATRDLLGFLFTRLGRERLVTVVSYRSDDLHRRHPLRRTLAEWSRLNSVTRLNLEPLGADDVRALVRAMSTAGSTAGSAVWSGAPRPGGADSADSADVTALTAVSAGDVDDIVRRADGNAFFAEELLAAIVQSDTGESLPWQLADLLLVRLDRLSEDARRVVRVAAVAGRRVTHTALEAAAQMPAGQLETALREAIDSHVLQLTTSGRGYVFRHALLAEAVYDDLLPGERVRLHAAYAAVLAADPEHRAAELARHANASHDLPTAYAASLAAGDEAISLAAPQEALQHYETALELAPRVIDRPGDPELILAAVEAADAAGFTQRGIRLAGRALDELPADADPIDRATLLYASVLAALGNEVGDDVLTTSAEALRLVPVTPPTRLRSRLLALHARVLLSFGRDADAERHAREALAAGEAAGSELARTDARATVAILERRKGDPHGAAALLAAVVEQARRSEDFGTEVRSRYGLGSLWYDLTDLDRAEHEFALGHRRAVETGRQWGMWGVHARAMTATVQYVHGEWDAALRTLDTAGERPTGLAAAILRSTGMAVRAGRGDATVLTELDDLGPYRHREGRIGLYAAYAAIELHEQRADVDSALAVIAEIVEELSRLWLDPWFAGRIQLSAIGIATLAAAAAGAPASRHAALAAEGERLHADGRRGARGGEAPTTPRRLGREGVAWLARLEAEAARLRWLTGHDAPSADSLVDAWQATVDAFGFGHVPQVARSQVRLAEALRAVGRGAEAVAAADRAREAAQRLGAAPLSAELRALGGERRTGRAGRSGGAGLTALTDREQGVLAELVDGRTNRQIAAKLFISEKTVSVHVTNIMGKLGVRSRAEAAALARRG
ncbi:regulatory protein, luxR family [Jatrophihabitans endophyticus]|uniref:Regulatory protein, luxR family n=1 Tax=Jatrophihabitans endophyticus TaxID=1206085 RepID=A0A1M5CCC9_9ACTN|nr:LuxR family transcriptional regulator [Jatrophihabitans endophyticus]SHF52247.1 regulatory protein, luxR family [Jatrophihabitans endophyticus]